jgi:hypothetical protein
MQWLKERVGVTQAVAGTELDSAVRLSNAVLEESARSFVNTLVKGMGHH